MSLSQSISTGSTSSSNTIPPMQLNEPEMDPSNILYNDHQNYQTIFTNDSRFFDTSLHLYKSYRKLGYIQSDKRKPLKVTVIPPSTNTLKPQINGYHHQSRSKSTGSANNHRTHLKNDETLKPQFSRNNGKENRSFAFLIHLIF